MSNERVMDEIVVTVLMPDTRPDAEYEPARAVSVSGEFRNRLRRSVRDVFEGFPDLACAQIRFS